MLRINAVRSTDIAKTNAVSLGNRLRVPSERHCRQPGDVPTIAVHEEETLIGEFIGSSKLTGRASECVFDQFLDIARIFRELLPTVQISPLRG